MAPQGYSSLVLPSSAFVVDQIPLHRTEGKRRHQTFLHVNGQVNFAVLPPVSVQEGGNHFGDNTIFDTAVIFPWMAVFPPQLHKALRVL